MITDYFKLSARVEPHNAETFNAANNAYDRWESAHTQLIHAAQAYLDASVAICPTFARARVNSVDKTWLKDRVLRLNHEIRPSNEVEKKIAEARALLNGMVSAAFPTIDTLPPELLSRVFMFASEPLSCPSNYESHALHPLFVIPLVCASWRHLAIATRSLWSDIIMDDGCWNSSMLEWLRTWLGRAHGSPLYLTFQSEGIALPTTRVFKQHITYAASLTFTHSDEGCFREILDMYSACGSIGVLKDLSVTGLSSPALALPDRFAWPVTALRNLVDLQLSRLSKPVSPTLSELVAILLSSPRLRTLEIRDVHVIPFGSGESPAIHLPQLEHFAFRLNNAQTFEQLLSKITPGPKNLTVRLGLPLPLVHNCDYAIRTFFAHAKVSKLYIQNLRPDSTLQWSSFLDLLPNLEVLFLNCSADRNCTSFKALTKRGEGGSTHATCPRLRSIGVIKANIGAAAWSQLKSIVESHRLERIRLAYGVRFDALEVEGILKWLQQRIGHVIYSEDRNFLLY